MQPIDVRDFVSLEVLQNANALQESFLSFQPFKSIVIDRFFNEAFCRKLLGEFPSFDARRALDEYGNAGRKDCHPQIKKISHHFEILDDLIRSPDFLSLIGTITGIDHLLYDPDYVGGGTHNSLHGQGLHPHVDFNYHPRLGWHRRLNFLLYLNETWPDEWGGCLELYDDPWTDATTPTQIQPLFNRVVIFETNEYSWHGFESVALPESLRSISRKSVALYFYSLERPANEIRPSHGTIYVPKLLPILDTADPAAQAELRKLQELVRQHRHLLKYMYQKEQDLAKQLSDNRNYLQETLDNLYPDVQGFVKLVPPCRGYYADRSLAQSVEIGFRPSRKARSISLDLYIPEFIPEQTLRLTCEPSAEVTTYPLPTGVNSLHLKLPMLPDHLYKLYLDFTKAISPKAAGINEDVREISAQLRDLVIE